MLGLFQEIVELLRQPLDPAEMTLNFKEATLFHDVESGREIYVDSSLARKQYVERLTGHLDASVAGRSRDDAAGTHRASHVTLHA